MGDKSTVTHSCIRRKRHDDVGQDSELQVPAHVAVVSVCVFYDHLIVTEPWCALRVLSTPKSAQLRRDT